jgi:anti-sigma regulatory factor (Ser/Thr protein kinase)
MEVALKARSARAQIAFVIDDESKIGEARRAAHTLALYEFDQTLAGRIAIVATELGGNLLKHAGGGQLLIQTLGRDADTTLEIISIDRGPGMANVARCMEDGYSTGGSPGTGLGAVRRLSSEFDIYSQPGAGTLVMSRIGPEISPRYGAISIAMHGEVECGDAWHIESNENAIAVLVVDGLGHGTFAAEAAQRCVATFMNTPFVSPADTLQRANAVMSATRGGAAAIALLRADGGVSYSGLGNISGALVGVEKSQGMVSHNGTLGAHTRRMAQFEYSRGPGAVLVMHSDGISTRWDIRSRPDLLGHHPALIAAYLYRDFTRDRDDATVVVLSAPG